MLAKVFLQPFALVVVDVTGRLAGFQPFQRPSLDCGLPFLEPGTPVYVEDLEAWERYAKIRISSGDAVFIRTGRWIRRA